MSQYIRVMATIEVPEGQDANKIAREMREAHAGDRVQANIAHIVVPNAVDGADDMKVVEHESFIHACDWYTEDECRECRRASSYSLADTQEAIYG